ncbi:aromatic ring-hydroxylating oxygenase subunit alpha [Paraliomyxa miuraensis]|uniref:aromatic ring-hydroxylating oxygenase subunit alpha n=1 Tax=Paraliomyxa miuraensis TaxID=376150 RepID=UPI00224ECB65|nr:SRPBCC family protein [Paraliomyxa miuraensis]MCX4246894.1 Rieske 2Fe-2S domain-containing protein [Paraliomyxa miuraensis]
MDQAVQVELVERLLAHVEHHSTDLEEPSQRSVSAYIDPERFERERRLFTSGPMALGHASMLASPGDFLNLDGVRPLLLVRQDDGSVRGMLNVCRHRGTPVEHEPRGHRARFTCPYHGWSYRLDGTLAGIPHRRGFPGVQEDTHSLQPVAVEQTAGLLWAGGDPRMGALTDELRGFGLHDGVLFGERARDYALNWKLVFDIFLEAYHVRVAHARTIAPMFLDNVYLVDPYPPHLRNVFPKRTIVELAGRPREHWRLREHANVLYVLFPNTLVLIQPDHSAVLHVVPLAVDRTRLLSYAVIPEAPCGDKARGHWDANMRILYSAVDEDFALGEGIHRNLASGANETLTFGAYEHALTRFHAQVDAAIA